MHIQTVYCGFWSDTDRVTKQNGTKTEHEWNRTGVFEDGVETLINQINNRLRYATYTQNHMSGRETVDIAIQIILRTGIFREDCANWHQRQPGEQTWYNFQKIMREQCRLHRLTSATAESFGYGGNA